jgi:hypothetical protein
VFQLQTPDGKGSLFNIIASDVFRQTFKKRKAYYEGAGGLFLDFKNSVGTSLRAFWCLWWLQMA